MTLEAAPHRFALRVYWEDTDAGGIVYYANYLKFIERARSELVGGAGVDQTALWDEAGVMFAVRRCELDYLAPARLGDALTVETRLGKVGGASVEMDQTVLRDGAALVKAMVKLGCIGRDGRPARMPADVRAALGRRTD
ncbi:MAG: tol-pal system-associated acyl-CoA thioesterase [Roseitalea porphyridii]